MDLNKISNLHRTLNRFLLNMVKGHHLSISHLLHYSVISNSLTLRLLQVAHLFTDNTNVL